MHVTAIIAAGGRGQRFGGARPKQLLSVAGRPVLERSVAAFLTHPSIDEIVVALPAGLADDPPGYLRGTSKPLHIVAGGPRRQDSVVNAFHAVSERSDVIVIHDAARPFASAGLIARTIAAAAEAGAALAAVQANDTVKQGHLLPAAAASASGDVWIVDATLPRESIFLAQTPQAFRREVLREALALGEDATDEAALAERAGHIVRIVEGEVSNIKITTPGDLAVAETLARGGHDDGSVVRVGTGYDLHRLVEGRPLILGGVTIPFERGLSGHSDADAVCHAVTDAVLGAAAAGDIGRHFPDTDPQWRGASSVGLLKLAAGLVRDRGYRVANVDVVVIAERPRLAPWVDAMRANVGEAIDLALDRVSIKGKTNEGIGELGRGEAIAVHAVALLRKSVD
jgi:2-C-methyl-D-erythritol 4-phosphate cytidylyltransferase / 2-C-methyl-D-erythritol 2,4-cyclodiphosphate synthase